MAETNQEGIAFPLSNNHGKDNEYDSDYDTNDDEFEMYDEYFQSVRSSTGLEVGVRVTWPGCPEFELSTCLSSDFIAPMFHGTQWAGTRVWRAAIVALQYLLLDDSNTRIQEETTVLELGCGLGVPGMIVHALKNCPVVLTDMDSLVGQLRNNITKIFPNDFKIQAQELDWSKKGVDALTHATSQPNGWDIVLNCDCIYEPLYGDSWTYLIECQEALLIRNSRTTMLTSVERRRADGIEKYLETIQKSPVVDRVEMIEIPFEHPQEVELYRIYGKPG